MSTPMPERQTSGLVPVDADHCTVGKVSNGARIVICAQLGLQVLLLSPKAARRIAPSFETPDAVAAGLDWIAEALRTTADEVKAMSPAEHAQMVALSAAMVEAHGATRQ